MCLFLIFSRHKAGHPGGSGSIFLPHLQVQGSDKSLRVHSGCVSSGRTPSLPVPSTCVAGGAPRTDCLRLTYCPALWQGGQVLVVWTWPIRPIADLGLEGGASCLGATPAGGARDRGKGCRRGGPSHVLPEAWVRDFQWGAWVRHHYGAPTYLPHANHSAWNLR